MGCCAIIVSRQCQEHQEYDSFSSLSYTSTGKQGAAALFKSFQESKPIRVFRSSDSKSPFAAIPKKKESAAWYRYDGVYHVIKAYDTTALQDGTFHVISQAPKNDISATFLLTRYNHNPGEKNAMKNTQLFLHSIANQTMKRVSEMGNSKEWSEKEVNQYFLKRWGNFWTSNQDASSPLSKHQLESPLPKFKSLPSNAVTPSPPMNGSNPSVVPSPLLLEPVEEDPNHVEETNPERCRSLRGDRGLGSTKRVLCPTGDSLPNKRQKSTKKRKNGSSSSSSTQSILDEDREKEDTTVGLDPLQQLMDKAIYRFTWDFEAVNVVEV